MNEFFQSLDVVWANYLSMLGFVFLLVIVWLIPRRLIYAGAPDQARSRYSDLGYRPHRHSADAVRCLQLTLDQNQPHEAHGYD